MSDRVFNNKIEKVAAMIKPIDSTKLTTSMSWQKLHMAGQKLISLLVILFVGACFWSLTAQAATDNSQRPNIVVIWGDDVGMFNISAYNRGMMGYKTPNIDRIANEGMLFTDAYGEQSCTAGRSAFITGQHPIRTGLTKVACRGQTRACVLRIQLWPSC